MQYSKTFVIVFYHTLQLINDFRHIFYNAAPLSLSKGVSEYASDIHYFIIH